MRHLPPHHCGTHGTLGALLWALVVVITGYQIGWIAWAVGAMVGHGVAWGNGGVVHEARSAGILAVVITILAIPAGKICSRTRSRMCPHWRT